MKLYIEPGSAVRQIVGERSDVVSESFSQFGDVVEEVWFHVVHSLI